MNLAHKWAGALECSFGFSASPEDSPRGRPLSHGGLWPSRPCECESGTRGHSLEPPWGLQTSLQGEGGEEARFRITAELYSGGRNEASSQR